MNVNVVENYNLAALVAQDKSGDWVLGTKGRNWGFVYSRQIINEKPWRLDRMITSVVLQFI